MEVLVNPEEGYIIRGGREMNIGTTIPCGIYFKTSPAEWNYQKAILVFW